MRRTVKVTSAPASSPVSLAEVKAWLRIDTSDEDALLASLIGAATDAAEQYTRRAFINQTIRLTVDLASSRLDDMLGDGVYDLPVSALFGDMPQVIELPRPPVSSITSVTTYNTAGTSSTFASSNYSLNADGTRLYLNQGCSWPSDLRPIAACEILYVAGYGASASSVPQAIKTAILMHIAHLYESRGVCDGAVPAGCANLLRQYRIMDGLAYG